MYASSVRYAMRVRASSLKRFSMVFKFDERFDVALPEPAVCAHYLMRYGELYQVL